MFAPIVLFVLALWLTPTPPVAPERHDPYNCYTGDCA